VLSFQYLRLWGREATAETKSIDFHLEFLQLRTLGPDAKRSFCKNKQRKFAGRANPLNREFRFKFAKTIPFF
jgi:hypothetical protein